MNEPKPFASLSSGLLARKGAAKPAMRPQGFTHFGGGLEDLGWNDMGMGIAPDSDGFIEEPQEHVPSSIAALTPAPRPHDLEAPAEGTEPEFMSAEDESPEDKSPEFAQEADESAPEFIPTPVEQQQRAIAASFSAELPAPFVAPSAPAPVVHLPRKPRSAPGLKDKAAFTLRLDPERHLKLRLACAVKHRSAQQIVTEALDEFLHSLPELDAMAGQVPARAGKQK